MMKIDVNKSGRIFDFLVSSRMLILAYDRNAKILPPTNGKEGMFVASFTAEIQPDQLSGINGAHGIPPNGSYPVQTGAGGHVNGISGMTGLNGLNGLFGGQVNGVRTNGV